MSERQRYDDLINQKLNDLPVPGEEAAWEKMKKLLDKKEDDDKIVPPVFLKGCVGWSLLLLVILAGGWFVLKENTKNSGTTPQIKMDKEDSFKNNRAILPTSPAPGSNTRSPDTIGYKSQGKNHFVVKDTNQTGDTLRGNHLQPINTKITANDRSRFVKTPTKHFSKLITVTQHNRHLQKNIIAHDKVDKPIVNKELENDKIKNVTKDIKQEKDTAIIPLIISPDTIMVTLKDTVRITDSNGIHTNTIQKEKAGKPFRLYVGAGLLLQQQIPFSRQKATPYTYYGRKGSVADYIPAPFLRLYKDKKWFVQLEFRYGAPQLVRATPYSQQIFRDSGVGVLYRRTITTTLRKTFYHQVPLSFNYYVLPRWSVGSGFLYSKFYRAISEVEDVKRNVTSQEEVVTKKITFTGSDSSGVFSKSQLHVLFQTEYQWKHFGVGLRYTKGLQPFIKYTDVNGRPKEDKNQALQLFLMYQLWQPKKQM